MCKYCKNEDFVKSTTTYVVDYKGKIIIVKNVPCMECSQCGDKYFTKDIALELEKLVDNAKKEINEVSIMDYKMAA